MNFPKESSRRGLLTRLCHVILDKDVQQGIGAVLVLVGFTLLVSGVIFTVVAYTSTKRNAIGSFPYVGPVLTVLGVVCIVNGYLLGHKDDFIQLWFYFKRRKQQAYTEQDYCDCESEELNGSVSAICFRVLVCFFIRRNTREVIEPSTDDVGSRRDTREMSSACEAVKKTEQRNKLGMTSSFSPFRQSKIHPSITESSV